MNVLQIKIKEDGTIECNPDFKIIRGSYGNILMNVEVPHSLLLDPIMDEGKNNMTGNNVRVGAIIHTITGKNLETQNYELERVKDYEQNGVKYRLYQRIMPKEFTLWDTVNSMENATESKLNLVFNVINWTLKENQAKIEQITASPILRLNVYASTFMTNEEGIDNPSDFDILQSQVQDLSASIDNTNTEIDNLRVETDEKLANLKNEVTSNINNLDEYAQQVDDKVDELKEELGITDNTLGNYLQNRIVAGKNINIQHNTDDLTINVENVAAKNVTFTPTLNVVASNVQAAIEVLGDKVNNSGSGGSGKNEIVLFQGPLKEEDAYLVISGDDKHKSMFTYIPFDCNLEKDDIIRLYFSYVNKFGAVEEDVIDYRVIAVEKYRITKEMAEEEGFELEEEFDAVSYGLATFGITDIIPEPQFDKNTQRFRVVDFKDNNTIRRTSKLMLGGPVSILYNFDKMATLAGEMEKLFGNGFHVDLGTYETSNSNGIWWNYGDGTKTTQILESYVTYGDSGKMGCGHTPIYSNGSSAIDENALFYQPVVFNKITCIKKR